VVTAKDGRAWTASIGPSPTVRLYITAALQAGARRSELIRLRWSDVDFKTGLLTFAHTKNGDTRRVPMTATMRGPAPGAPPPARRDGPGAAPRAPLVITRAFRRLVRRLGIAALTFHDLRHDAASQLAMAGVPIRTIAEILGHRSLQMTLRYAHLAPGHL
jgi:integrase